MIKYPNNKKNNSIKSSDEAKKRTTSNRGMSLEEDINLSNKYYLVNDIAVIYKKPTPVTIVKVDYPNRKSAKIVEAYYNTPSTTDFNGLYKGHYIDFEAKETNSKTSFAFSNIHQHQIEHLNKVDQQGGIAFIILRFNFYNQTFLVKATSIIKHINSGFKSIKYDIIVNEALLIDEGYQPRLNYLKTVDKMFNI